MDVSIIIPLYKGQKYLSRILKMINSCIIYKKLYINCTAEIVLVNDYPGEKIEIEKNSCPIDIVLIEHEVNKGIHASRVDGIKVSRGEYIIMLDQDDYIKEEWLYSQWMFCQNTKADYCVCNAWISRFKTLQINKGYVNDIEFYLSKGNVILSPGQVIIRKSAIPYEWIINIQKCNGADDYLLWIMALKCNYRFIINNNYLYFHTPDRTPDSIGCEKMIVSLNETKDILQSVGFLDVRESLLLENQIENRKLIEKGEINEIDNRSVINVNVYKRMKILAEIFQKWVKLKNHSIDICRYFNERNFSKIAIYGIGEIGENLYGELSKSDIEVLYGIDRNAKDFKDELEILKIEDDLKFVDVVIVAMTKLNEDSCEILRKKTGGKVILFQDILNSLEEYVV